MHRGLHSECTEVCLKRATEHASGELISLYSCLTEYRYAGKRGSSVSNWQDKMQYFAVVMILLVCVSQAIRQNILLFVGQLQIVVDIVIVIEVRQNSIIHTGTVIKERQMKCPEGIKENKGGVKRSGREPDNAPPSGAELKNERSCTSTPPKCLRGMYTGKYTFTFLCAIIHNLSALAYDNYTS